jgi:hypothetical protein
MIIWEESEKPASSAGWMDRYSGRNSAAGCYSVKFGKNTWAWAVAIFCFINFYLSHRGIASLEKLK